MEAVFWADKKAQKITSRTKFCYLDKEVPEFDKYVIKTSASISGVLHLGRLSDTIRSDSVCRALKDAGYSAQLIWVAEDMDPLRKIPEGVPGRFKEYIGMPVVAIPDPWDCHSSFAEHHISEYLEVLDEFVSARMKKYSMEEEYRKGNFRPWIKKLLENLKEVIEIQNKYRQKPLGHEWSPWMPVCENCGKIVTPRIKEVSENRVAYVCKDYTFETQIAAGCGYEGENNPLAGEGKLLWKGEWAAQWARWKVASEGAGKEYVVPTSAWWVNAEIVECVFDFPMPVPIFYEHLMIDGKKMSASLGNVVYPRDWLRVAPAELLRFFYNKKLMKTRSFSWRDLPKLYDEYDTHAKTYFEEGARTKEIRHMRRLYEISQLREVEKPLNLPFSHAVMVSQIFSDEKEIIKSLKRSGHYEKKKHNLIMKRMEYAKNWASSYAPEEMKVSLSVDLRKVRAQLSDKQKSFLQRLAVWLEEDHSPEEIHNQIYKLGREVEIPPNKAFQAIYFSILGSARGPRAGTFLASLDRDWLIKRFREVLSPSL